MRKSVNVALVMSDLQFEKRLAQLAADKNRKEREEKATCKQQSQFCYGR